MSDRRRWGESREDWIVRLMIGPWRPQERARNASWDDELFDEAWQELTMLAVRKAKADEPGQLREWVKTALPRKLFELAKRDRRQRGGPDAEEFDDLLAETLGEERSASVHGRSAALETARAFTAAYAALVDEDREMWDVGSATEWGRDEICTKLGLSRFRYERRKARAAGALYEGIATNLGAEAPCDKGRLLVVRAHTAIQADAIASARAELEAHIETAGCKACENCHATLLSARDLATYAGLAPGPVAGSSLGALKAAFAGGAAAGAAGSTTGGSGMLGNVTAAVGSAGAALTAGGLTVLIGGGIYAGASKSGASEPERPPSSQLAEAITQLSRSSRQLELLPQTERASLAAPRASSFDAPQVVIRQPRSAAERLVTPERRSSPSSPTPSTSAPPTTAAGRREVLPGRTALQTEARQNQIDPKLNPKVRPQQREPLPTCDPKSSPYC